MVRNMEGKELSMKSHYTYIYLLLIISIVLNTAGVESTPPSLLPYKDSEYFCNKPSLELLLKNQEMNTIIQVGCWYGKSTEFLARYLNNNGKLYAIDSWIGYPREIYKNTYNVYEQFLSNIQHSNLEKHIYPIRLTSLSAYKYFVSNIGCKADLIYIDCDHAYIAVFSDLETWGSLLKPGGIFCGNMKSLDPDPNSIKSAVLDFCRRYEKKALFIKNLWIIQ